MTQAQVIDTHPLQGSGKSIEMSVTSLATAVQEAEYAVSTCGLESSRNLVDRVIRQAADVQKNLSSLRHQMNPQSAQGLSSSVAASARKLERLIVNSTGIVRGQNNMNSGVEVQSYGRKTQSAQGNYSAISSETFFDASRNMSGHGDSDNRPQPAYQQLEEGLSAENIESSRRVRNSVSELNRVYTSMASFLPSQEQAIHSLQSSLVRTQSFMDRAVNLLARAQRDKDAKGRLILIGLCLFLVYTIFRWS